MIATLLLKFLRDLSWPLLVVCLVLFSFATLWVKVAQRVTTEIAPFFLALGTVAKLPNVQKTFDEIVFSGPGKVSQAVLGGADIRFEKPNDFLTVQMLHPVVFALICLWGVGRTAGAISGEIERGTMELLLAQPVPREQLILAHLLTDFVVIPVLSLSLLAGTQFGLWLVGPFEVDYSVLKKLPALPPGVDPNQTGEVLPVSALGQWGACLNLMGLLFAISGITLAFSCYGRSRWRTISYAALVVLLMYIVNVVGQLWDSIAFLRPLTLFFYYNPQNIWLKGQWLCDVGTSWGMAEGFFMLPGVFLLFFVGGLGYFVGLRHFLRRDLPAPL